jgi:hypothetical protein
LRTRTDPNLEPNIEEDYSILRGMAVDIFPRFKNQISELDDIYQTLCEIYLEALISYGKKIRVIPKRPFVFMYIKFILKRMYRGQFKFENRSIFPVEQVLDPEIHLDDKDELFTEHNPFLFEYSYDLNRILNKYSVEERIIIYYKWFMNCPIKFLHLYTNSKKKITYLKIKNLRERLKRDPDLIRLLKDK